MKIKSNFIINGFYIVIPLCIVVLIISIFIQYGDNRYTKLKYQENEKKIVAAEKVMLQNKLHGMISDIDYLSYLFQAHQEDYQVDTYINLTNDWKAFLNCSTVYVKLRFMDLEGMEKIKLIYSQTNGAYKSSQSKLEDKSDRYYYDTLKNLQLDQLYLSPLDLEVENTQVKIPEQPILRLCKAVMDNDTFKKEGYIILSYDGSHLFNDFRSIATTSYGNVVLVNEEGHWLHSSDQPEKEWSFMYDSGENVTFATEYPEAWEQIKSGVGGIITTKDGLFTYEKLSPASEMIMVNSVSTSVIDSGESWFIISHISSATENGSIFKTGLFQYMIHTVEKQKNILFILVFLSSTLSLLLITNRKIKSKLINYSTDSLTGAYTRKTGLELLEASYEETLQDYRPLTLCFIDIDGLKQVNDTYGHELGDSLITIIVGIINKEIRDTDYIIRMGGDEFLIVFPKTRPAQVNIVWKRILDNLESVNNSHMYQFNLSVSHGISEFLFTSDETIENVIHEADQRMYKEKYGRECRKC